VSAQAWCAFELAGGQYGVELARVQEVLRPQPVTRLPLAPPAIAGLLNLRGRIVPVVDPCVVLERGAAPDREHGGIVVVHGADGPVALLVDAIGDVRRAGTDTAAPVLPAADAAERTTAPLVTATFALDDRLLDVLDLDRLLARAFARPLPGVPS